MRKRNFALFVCFSRKDFKSLYVVMKQPCYRESHIFIFVLQWTPQPTPFSEGLWGPWATSFPRSDGLQLEGWIKFASRRDRCLILNPDLLSYNEFLYCNLSRVFTFTRHFIFLGRKILCIIRQCIGYLLFLKN